MERALCRVPSRDRSECHNRQLAQETAGDGLGFPPLSASQTAWSNAESKPSCNPSWRRSASHPPLTGRASALYARGRECGRWLVAEYPRGRAASEQREPVGSTNRAERRHSDSCATPPIGETRFESANAALASRWSLCPQ